MKDFKSYSEENQPKQNTPSEESGNAGGNASTSPSEVNTAVEMVKILTKAMNGKSEGQILRTILSEAERGKREGRLTNDDLDNFYNALSPLLDGMKRKKLKEIITKLKNLG